MNYYFFIYFLLFQLISFSNCGFPTRNPTFPPRVPTLQPTIIPTFQPTIVPTQFPTRVPTFSPSRAPTLPVTFTPTITTFQPTINPTRFPTRNPTFSPSSIPTLTSTSTPTTFQPTINPTRFPTRNPTFNPSRSPTFQPTIIPTLTSTSTPTTLTTTFQPSFSPTVIPTRSPTRNPSFIPSSIPTLTSTSTPTTLITTFQPTLAPTRSPTRNPTFSPSSRPTFQPTRTPTSPTNQPTLAPTRSPTFNPSRSPTFQPTIIPTLTSTSTPTTLITTFQPTVIPTRSPTRNPTFIPSRSPTLQPTRTPTSPTNQPTIAPTRSPTRNPTFNPSSRSPTFQPTRTPTSPTNRPTINPTRFPTRNPTRTPSIQPILTPVGFPTRAPTSRQPIQTQITPTALPSLQFFSPTRAPTRQTSVPTSQPSRIPTFRPSIQLALPSYQPSVKPSSKPSPSPTPIPTFKIQSKPKHIVIFIADDLGWDDVGFHGNKQVSTPFIDSLARSGVIIDRFYVQPICSPTRSALLTGRGAVSTSMYDNLFLGLKTNFTLLPHHLTRLGYSCHLVGKWHLGDATWSNTPLYRGFETSFGTYSGSGDHYQHNYENRNNLDFWDQKTPRFDLSCWDGNNCPNNTYTTHLFANRAIEIIENSKDSSSPLFLYVSFTSPHLPYQAPQDVIDLYNETITHPLRRVYVAMLHVLDNAIENITKSLEKNNMLDDTLILFMSDNGAMVDMRRDGEGGGMGSNWPLRGSKRTLYEGGVRVPSFVTGAGISSSRKGTIVNGLFHAMDWFPTLLTMAAKQINPLWSWKDVITLKSNEPEFTGSDARDQWSYISGETDTPARYELLLETHALGSRTGTGNALIVGNWKILLRTASLWPYTTNIGSNDGWFGGINSSDPDLGAYAVPIGETNQNYTIKCPSPPSDYISSYSCVNKEGIQKDDISYACLFNLAADPCEQVDLSSEKPALLKQLWDRLNFYRQRVYEYPCTRCKSGLSCPFDQDFPSCSNNWRSGANNCIVEMPC